MPLIKATQKVCDMIPPSKVIGIIGGGQLGRMTALAAARLGYRCHIFCDDPTSPATHVTSLSTIAAFDDVTALETFAKSVDVVTFEWENIPLETLRLVSHFVPTHPSSDVLQITQDRVQEKQMIERIGHATAPWSAVCDLDTLRTALTKLGYPSLLKTARAGYDGKGQILLHSDTDLTHAWQRLGTDHALVETLIPFTREVSVIVARRVDGQQLSYPVVENHHVDSILTRTLVPAPLSTQQATIAHTIAQDLAQTLEVVGLLTVEMFETKDGRFLVNELAPRPHNSGHWTIDACMTSQFEQLIRTICSLPLGRTDVLSPAVMENLLGEDIQQWSRLLDYPNARVHVYGKQELRPKRKMGHVTWLGNDVKDKGEAQAR